jgi:hypothetical protein
MKKNRIDFDEIQKAREDTERDAFDYFLDRKTGEVIILSEDLITKAREILSRSYDDDIADYDDVEPDEVPEIPEWMEDEVELALEIFVDNSERYIRIPERNHALAFAAMKDFTASLDNDALKNMLLRALDGQGSFRNFKNILGPFPKERKAWYNFNAKAARKEIEEWLSSMDAKLHAE